MQRLYLDTSVLSALVDTRAPERCALTTAFWVRRTTFALITSDVASAEIRRTPDAAIRSEMLRHFGEVEVVPLTDEMRHLAKRYVDRAIFTTTMEADALHVAAATVLACDALLSWNFRHLVNRSRRLAVNAENVRAGFGALDIIPPPEL